MMQPSLAGKRPTWEQRDNCIHKIGWKSCYSLDKDRASDAYKACVDVERKVEAYISGESGSSDACHEMNMDMDYGSYQAEIKDDYYQCVREAENMAKENEYYFKNEFKPLFIRCASLVDHEAD